MSGGSEKELVQLIDCRLDSSDHILQPLNAAREFSQVNVVINSNGHQLFSRALFRDFLNAEVVQVLLASMFLDEIGRS